MVRRYESIKRDLAYLQDTEEKGWPLGVNITAMTLEMLIDIREILLDMAEKEGVDVESHFIPELNEEENISPEDDGAGVPSVGDSESDQDPADDEVPIGTDSWLSDRATQLRVGLHDLPDADGGEAAPSG